MLMNTDPKILLAQNLPEVDPATAEYAELLRVPGIGPVSASSILKTRDFQNVKHPDILRACGVIMKRAMPYLSLGRTKQTTFASWC